MKITEIENQIIGEFDFIDDPMMRYEFLIDLGKKLPSLPEELRTDQNLVKGCQSLVWLQSDASDGLVIFRADSNTVITRGMIALLIRVLSGQKPDDVIQAELAFIDRIQLRSHLSQQRSNGLNAMILRMKGDAMRLKANAGVN